MLGMRPSLLFVARCACLGAALGPEVSQTCSRSECRSSAGDGPSDDSSLLQARRQTTAHSKSPIDSLRTAFQSDGFIISTGGHESTVESGKLASTTLLRHDLPMSNYKHPQKPNAGLVYKTGSESPEVLCSYVSDAATDQRHPNKCTNFCSSSMTHDQFNRNITRQGLKSVGTPYYFLHMCAFSDVGTMTNFQKSLLLYIYNNYDAVQSGRPWWLWSQGRFGPTLYDEVILAPYTSDKVVGIFWAHDGRLLDESEKGFAEVCSATANYTQQRDRLPVFQLAHMYTSFGGKPPSWSELGRRMTSRPFGEMIREVPAQYMHRCKTGMPV